MATNNCGTPNCGCTNSYTVTAPCPPSCPEVFNTQCIVYTGTDIMCNQDVVIKRYDYLDTIITKLVNYLCNVEAPVSVVVGSEYIDVVPNVVGNVTTYTVYVDVPALQAYFEIIFGQQLAASILAGPAIDVAVNPATDVVTISHADTSSVANLSSDNSGNSFIQDIFFTFDTFGHVVGASVVPGTVIPPNDYDRAQINPDSGFVWGPDNDPTNIQIAEAPGDTLNFVAGVGIALNASTVPGTDAIRITNTAPAVPIVLTSAGGTETLVNDGTGPSLATKGLTAGNGITLSGSATAVTITAAVNKFVSSVIDIPIGGSVLFTHNLNSLDVVVSGINKILPLPFITYAQVADYTYEITSANTITVFDATGAGLPNFCLTVIG
jgi:hypothetical protein